MVIEQEIGSIKFEAEGTLVKKLGTPDALAALLDITASIGFSPRVQIEDTRKSRRLTYEVLLPDDKITTVLESLQRWYKNYTRAKGASTSNDLAA